MRAQRARRLSPQPRVSPSLNPLAVTIRGYQIPVIQVAGGLLLGVTLMLMHVAVQSKAVFKEATKEALRTKIEQLKLQNDESERELMLLRQAVRSRHLKEELVPLPREVIVVEVPSLLNNPLTNFPSLEMEKEHSSQQDKLLVSKIARWVKSIRRVFHE